MLDFALEQFHIHPNQRWPWLAHAALTAKYRDRDLVLALKYARAITEKATAPSVPYWARDLSVILLADMGEAEAARGLISALLREGNISDPAEIRFLEQKLQELEAPKVGTSAGSE
jgi:hypothetical protein